ncbi:pentapeptide repeat-containing protein [Pseudotamlana agarivorans]|uniref:pentapeptide repeat-containing protein n=1 Tax=Pseudotamlana agarivorans TaxID=481183 RepID=UPI0008360921|nr:pentapeptide repeat-containing protein [Tamlana agarivorans]
MVEDQTFSKQDFTENRLPHGDYEYCSFINCNFSKSFLNGINFLECEFIDCNLSSANITNTAFQDVKFQDCKMLGLHFETCNDFGFSVRFLNCIINHTSFYQVDLKTSKFENSKCHEVEFTEADLRQVSLNNCDLEGATFNNSNLERTDFRTATNYNIHPGQNKIKGAKFSAEGHTGLLRVYKIVIE